MEFSVPPRLYLLWRDSLLNVSGIASFDDGGNSSASLVVTVFAVHSRISHFSDKLLRSSSDLCYFSYVNLILIYSMVQSPSWEANWFAAIQEIPHISQNPNVHYRTHKRPPTVSILGQPNPVHIPTSHLLEIHPNIIHPSTHRSHRWSLSLRFPHQDLIHPLLLTPTRHMPTRKYKTVSKRAVCLVCVLGWIFTNYFKFAEIQM